MCEHNHARFVQLCFVLFFVWFFVLFIKLCCFPSKDIFHHRLCLTSSYLQKHGGAAASDVFMGASVQQQSDEWRRQQSLLYGSSVSSFCLLVFEIRTERTKNKKTKTKHTHTEICFSPVLSLLCSHSPTKARLRHCHSHHYH